MFAMFPAEKLAINLLNLIECSCEVGERDGKAVNCIALTSIGHKRVMAFNTETERDNFFILLCKIMAAKEERANGNRPSIITPNGI